MKKRWLFWGWMWPFTFAGPVYAAVIGWALVIVLFFQGCAGGPNLELCINHPKYGQVCAVRVDGKWFLKADLAPDAAKEVLDQIKADHPD